MRTAPTRSTAPLAKKANPSKLSVGFLAKLAETVAILSDWSSVGWTESVVGLVFVPSTPASLGPEFADVVWVVGAATLGAVTGVSNLFSAPGVGLLVRSQLPFLSFAQLWPLIDFG